MPHKQLPGHAPRPCGSGKHYKACCWDKAFEWVTGEAGGNWHVELRELGWEQVSESPRPPAATVTMDQDTAWKVVTKRRSRESIRQQFPGIRITGDESLGLHALGMVSVMA
jgi:hypothetical protein